MAKAKIYELDIVRAFAILAVLLIHATSDGTVDLSAGSRAHVLFIAVNKLSNFAVPVFFLLSGLVLFYRYFDDWSGRQALAFYRKRLQYILVPYLIWSLFYYLFNGWLQHPDRLKFNLPEFLEELKWADTGYHLYFMIIILQFYAIFPLMVTLARSFRWFARGLVWVGIVVQAGTYIYNHWIGEIPHLSTLCIQYFAAYCIGGAIGIRYGAFKEWLNRNIWWVACLGTALGFMLAGLFELSAFGLDLGQTVYFLLFNSYAAIIGMVLIYAGSFLRERLPRLTVLLNSLGAASFGVYFIHPSLLSAWRNFIVPPVGSAEYYYSFLASTLLIIIVPWLIVLVLKKVKFSWILFGK
jgi:peptidoglycan/LPS O-acetylase OafA/YrhL